MSYKLNPFEVLKNFHDKNIKDRTIQESRQIFHIMRNVEKFEEELKNIKFVRRSNV